MKIRSIGSVTDILVVTHHKLHAIGMELIPCFCFSFLTLVIDLFWRSKAEGLQWPWFVHLGSDSPRPLHGVQVIKSSQWSSHSLIVRNTCVIAVSGTEKSFASMELILSSSVSLYCCNVVSTSTLAYTVRVCPVFILTLTDVILNDVILYAYMHVGIARAKLCFPVAKQLSKKSK